MEHEDPEKRIDDLERGLAEPHGRVTAEDVHTVAFSKPAFLKRGYNEDEVDALLERAEAALLDPTAPGALTAAEMHDVSFSKPPIGKRGYNEDEVDAFLDRVKIELSRRASDPGQP